MTDWLSQQVNSHAAAPYAGRKPPQAYTGEPQADADNYGSGQAFASGGVAFGGHFESGHHPGFTDLHHHHQ